MFGKQLLKIGTCQKTKLWIVFLVEYTRGILVGQRKSCEGNTPGRLGIKQPR